MVRDGIRADLVPVVVRHTTQSLLKQVANRPETVGPRHRHHTEPDAEC
jgi:hypothetical protein